MSSDSSYCGYCAKEIPEGQTCSCVIMLKDKERIRTFETGAMRDTDQDKLDYEAFLSPLVLERYARYLHKNRKMKDGTLRDSDNWQKGIPLSAYMKSLWRHFFDVWFLHRYTAKAGNLDYSQEEALCAVIFNASGYLHELLKTDQPAFEQDEIDLAQVPPPPPTYGWNE